MPFTSFQNYTEAFLRLIYPAHCGSCKRMLEVTDRAICPACNEWLSEKQLPPWEEIPRNELNDVDEAWALYYYEPPVQELISRMKFFGQRRLLKAFLPAIKNFAEGLRGETDYDLIIPLPMDPKRRWFRDYHLAELIAEKLAENMGLPVFRQLSKRYTTPAQSGLTRQARSMNLEGAFRLKSDSRVKGKKILLVDDILTTGSTADEAARLLKAGGAEKTGLMTLAWTVLSRETAAKHETSARNQLLL